MNKGTMRSLSSIKNMMEQLNQYKRYMRLQEATRNYQLDRRVIVEMRCLNLPLLTVSLEGYPRNRGRLQGAGLKT